MSLNSALNSALTGLQVSSRRAEVVSRNVANAGRPGFGARELEITPISSKLQGLRTTIQRTEDAAAMSLRREASGQAAAGRDGAALWTNLANVIGQPGDGDSLSGLLAAFETRLIEATSNPGSPTALTAVRDAAASVATLVNRASDAVQTSRQQAEDRIVAEVADLNDALATIADLNTQIQKQAATSGETALLEDQRSLALDRVSDAVRIEVLQRDFGAIAIVSSGGQILLDGRPVEVEFNPSVQVTPDRTLGAGLNPLTVNGRPVSTGDGSGSMGGGRLQGLFDTRDAQAVGAQADLDALALEFVARFSGPDADPTLALGEAGLFVDPGAGEGAASRLQLNPLVASDGSDEVWRLRDGMAALAPDPANPVGVLDLHLQVLAGRAVPGDARLGTAARDLTGLVLEMTSGISAVQGRYADAADRADTRFAAAQERLAETGVDIDEEMRRLIEIEQSYAAAARVTEAVGDMMDRLTRI